MYVRFVKFDGVNGGMVMDTDTWCRPLRPSERTERNRFKKQIFWREIRLKNYVIIGLSLFVLLITFVDFYLIRW